MPRSRSNAVAGSPAAAAETVIATLAGLVLPSNDPVDIEGSCDVTVGTTGNAATLRIRRGADTTGTVLATYGPFTVVAANRVNLTINAVDTQVPELSGQGYVLTLQITAATAISTVNAAYLGALY